MLLTEQLLRSSCCVFGVIVMLEDPATTHLQCSYWGKEVVGQNLAIHGPIHPPLNTVQSSCPLFRKAPPKHDVSTPMLHGWDGVLEILLILLPPNTASGVYTKKLYFGLIWPHDLLPCLLWIMQMVLQTGLGMCWLEQGDLARAAGFNPWRCSVLLMVTVETVVPALFRSLILHKARSCMEPQSERDWQSSWISSIFHQKLLPSHQAVCLWSYSPSQPCAGLQFCP